MLTPMEIRNQQFSRGMRGLKEEEVKNFLYYVAQNYEALYSENARLKEQIQRLEYELARYRKLEDTMNNSLILAQQAAEEYKANARKEAEFILENAKRRIAEMLFVYQEIIKRLNIFNAEMKAQLRSELELLEKNQSKIDEMADFFYSKDVKEIMEKLEKITLKEDEHGQDNGS
ncbi:cell division initiation protein [Thermosyntropha lipolytica DSM 11003]|uniref:Cell division initiation protein n=1 Tax=Thermosyntropha lipolytica DSM 11003 TaxID=1123382 RepID=A0A1M5K8P8_9FIRM|nr:DivIVA domain-containing protein [Thermosyntropha lipolytica]SHG49214.1 cell division initiation protein [Thermosyntropha lipolytica DSM 11003]